MLAAKKSNGVILVFGDIMLDVYTHGRSSRLSPEAPVPVVDFIEKKYALGGCGNVAAGIRALDHDVELVGFYGDDFGGEKIRALLDACGVINNSVVIPQHESTLKNRIVVGGHQLVRIDRENYYEPDIKFIKDKIANFFKHYSVIIISDYNKGAAVRAADIIKEARQHGILTMVDPKAFDWSRYENCDIITPNREEFLGACSYENINGEIENSAQILMDKFSIGCIVITLGSEGMILATKGNNAIKFPAKAKRVFDVTGAGDTVVAALGCFLSRGGALIEAVNYANTAAAIAVSYHGTVAVTRRCVDQQYQ